MPRFASFGPTDPGIFVINLLTFIVLFGYLNVSVLVCLGLIDVGLCATKDDFIGFDKVYVIKIFLCSHLWKKLGFNKLTVFASFK